MSKTFGQVLDEYIGGELKPGQDISSVYLYMDDYQTPKMVIQTSVNDYDNTDIIYEVVDLREQVKFEATKLKELQDKVRKLQKSEREVIKAIKLLKESS